VADAFHSDEETAAATISSRISHVLAADIISGELPPGSKLDEVALSQRFGVSRTPIREALKDLAAKRLVEPAKRGVVVARIGIEELTDMLEADCEIEALCARLASQKMSALEKEHLKILCEKGSLVIGTENLAGYFVLNDRFHMLIAKGTHNDTLESTVRLLRNRLAPFRRAQPGEMSERLLQSVKEHQVIVEAISLGDGEAAYLAARSHNARLSIGTLLQVSNLSVDKEYVDTSPSKAPEKEMASTGAASVPIFGSSKIASQTRGRR
jgi:DNA-binding GntR family transcriptional regulator